MTNRTIASRALAPLALLLWTCAAAAPAAVMLEPVLLSGMQAPGQPAGVAYQGFSDASIAPDASIAFISAVGTTPQNAVRGVFSHSPVHGQRTVFIGESYFGPAAADGGTVLYTAGSPGINPVVSKPTGNTALPGWPARISPDGQTVVHNFSNGFDPASIWVGPVAARVKVATVGDPAPQAPGTTFYSFRPLAAGNASNAVFYAVLANTNFGDAMYGASVQGGTPSLQLLVRSGMPAAGFENQPPIASFIPAAASRSGWALVRGAASGVDTNSNEAIWAASPGGELRLVVREGQSLPTNGGLPATYNGFVDDIDIGDGGHVAFDNFAGIWRHDGTDLDMVMMPNRQIPNHGPGWQFGGTLGRPQVDGHGNVVFYDGNVKTPAGNGAGIIWAGIDGYYAVLARVGQTIDVNGTPKTIAAFGTPLGLYSNGWVEPRVLNDFGQVALGLRFHDGSAGLYVVHVPEPTGTAAVSLLALVVATTRRRRR